MLVTKDSVVTIKYTMSDPLGNRLNSPDGGDAASFIQGRGTLFPDLEANAGSIKSSNGLLTISC